MPGYILNEKDKDIFQQLASNRTRGMRPSWYKRRRSSASTGTGGTTTSPPIETVKIILIEKDHAGILEADPKLQLDYQLSDEDIDAGYSLVYQDPPSENFDLNHIENVPLWGCKPPLVQFKYYEAGDSVTGTAVTGDSFSITLDDNASDVNDYYNDDIITVNDGESGNDKTAIIVDYNGEHHVASVVLWDMEPDWGADPIYTITSLSNLKLSTTVIDDPYGLRKIVQYNYVTVAIHDKAFKVGKYDASAYTDREDDTWPPAGDPPAGFDSWNGDTGRVFFAKKFRGICLFKDIRGNWVFDGRFCKALPPPVIPEGGS